MNVYLLWKIYHDRDNRELDNIEGVFSTEEKLDAFKNDFPEKGDPWSGEGWYYFTDERPVE